MRQDVAYALRLLRRDASFAAVAILTLSLGIGATTAIFSVANWMLLRPVPGVASPEQVSFIWSGSWSDGGSLRVSFVSYPNYLDVRPRLTTLSGLAGHQTVSINVEAEGQSARPVPARAVSANYFSVLGVGMRLGRAFSEEEDNPAGAAQVAVISEALWASSFDRSHGVLGRTIRVNGHTFTIVGVASAFRGTERSTAIDLWIPGASQPLVNYQQGRRADSRTVGGFYEFVGRLAPGATWDRAAAELSSLGPWLAAQYPKENTVFAQANFHLMGEIGGPPHPAARAQLKRLVLLMAGASALVLLIACANVSGLLLMRGVARTTEMSVRKALGAGGGRLLRQQLTEAGLLWMFGGTAGLLLVWILTRSVDLAPIVAGVRTEDAPIPIDWRVGAFALAISGAAGLIFALLPGLRAVRIAPASTLRGVQSTHGGVTARTATVLSVVQVSASLALLVAALLLTATLRNLSDVDLGFDREGLAAFRINPAQVGYADAQAFAYEREFERRLAATPGVRSVSSADASPFYGSRSYTRIQALESSDKSGIHRTLYNAIRSAGYFATVGIPILRGRAFEPADIAVPGGRSRNVVILSRDLARRLFGSDDVVGRQVKTPVQGREAHVFEVIGISGPSRSNELTGPTEPILYEPAGLGDGTFRIGATIVVRSDEGANVAAAVRTIAASLNSALPAGPVTAVQTSIDVTRREWLTLGTILSAFATIAILLAGVGLYGVLAFAVAARRREIGIRMALGAAPRRIVRLVLRSTAIVTVAGLGLGLGAAVAAARAIESRLVGVQPFDPGIWSLAAALMVILAVAASVVPIRRALRVDVTETLRAP
jgi:predicted permease